MRARPISCCFSGHRPGKLPWGDEEGDRRWLALKERLPETFLDFAPYLDGCRFVGCSHTKEKGCAVLEAVRAGKLSASRHASYLRHYNELKDLREWSSK